MEIKNARKKTGIWETSIYHLQNPVINNTFPELQVKKKLLATDLIQSSNTWLN